MIINVESITRIALIFTLVDVLMSRDDVHGIFFGTKRKRGRFNHVEARREEIEERYYHCCEFSQYSRGGLLAGRTATSGKIRLAFYKKK